MPEVFLYITLIITGIVLVFIVLFKLTTIVIPPVPNDRSPENLNRNTLKENSYQCGKGWLRKNRNGLWEMYVEGEPYERGIITGKLTKELLEWQEQIFVDEIYRMVPSRFYLFFLKNLVLWINRKLHRYIDKEFNLEIYGISKSASNKFKNIGKAYKRLLNYHAAHDIGHVLQDMKYVGCTSFSAWGKNSTDGKIITGRNFDFYVNDYFGKEKILAFINPSSGLKFAMVTWGGMTGAVSGMNEKGLAITINAAKTSFKLKLGTPISIIVREMLQFSQNIEEAMNIAKKRSAFISELIMVSSASDKKTVIIEKTPLKTELFESKENQIICTNHCQSKELASDKYNVNYMKESASVYRFERVKELMLQYSPLNVQKTVHILQNKDGKEGKNIGFGNEESVNQLLAHHGIIFQPEEKIMYLSSPPYNMGEFMAYKLDDIFNIAQKGCPVDEIDFKPMNIPADDFSTSGRLKDYLHYKELLNQLNSKKSDKINTSIFNKIIELNPEYYLSYSTIGNYFKNKKQYSEAIPWYNKALEKEIHHKFEINRIKQSLQICFKNQVNNI